MIHSLQSSVKFRVYAIRNETSIGGLAIKTIQQQNEIGIVRALKLTRLKGEQNSSVEKGRPTTVQSLNYENLKKLAESKSIFLSCKMSSAANCEKTKHRSGQGRDPCLCTLNIR